MGGMMDSLQRNREGRPMLAEARGRPPSAEKLRNDDNVLDRLQVRLSRPRREELPQHRVAGGWATTEC
jgi:hypothetical protein